MTGVFGNTDQIVFAWKGFRKKSILSKSMAKQLEFFWNIVFMNR